MKKIVSVMSVDGPYFEIGENESGHYLKNLYTIVPSEFHDQRAIRDIQILFDEICEVIPKCIPLDSTSTRDGNCVRVVYDDGTSQVYKEQKDLPQYSLIPYINKISGYSDFFDSVKYLISKRRISVAAPRKN